MLFLFRRMRPGKSGHVLKRSGAAFRDRNSCKASTADGALVFFLYTQTKAGKNKTKTRPRIGEISPNRRNAISENENVDIFRIHSVAHQIPSGQLKPYILQVSIKSPRKPLGAHVTPGQGENVVGVYLVSGSRSILPRYSFNIGNLTMAVSIVGGLFCESGPVSSSIHNRCATVGPDNWSARAPRRPPTFSVLEIAFTSTFFIPSAVLQCIFIDGNHLGNLLSSSLSVVFEMAVVSL